MSIQKLFPDTDTLTKIELTYSTEVSSMKAAELGDSIVGMGQCLKEAANLALLDFDDVFILPIEKGSVRNYFIFIRRDAPGASTWQIVVGVGVVFALLNDGYDLIQKFGASLMRNPTPEVFQAAADPRIIKLCQSASFREGARKVAQPLSEVNNKVTVKYGENSFEIDCEQKYKFYENDLELIFPELRDGSEVTLMGEITRINKRTNDLGFLYKGRTLSVSPIENEKSIADYHQFLTKDEVLIRGVVVRSSEYETPKIKIQEISMPNEDQLPFNFMAGNQN